LVFDRFFIRSPLAGNLLRAQVTSAKMAADLSLLGDWAHNFTDGMAIAASFLVSHKVN
jgi:zinc transporter ZupT